MKRILYSFSFLLLTATLMAQSGFNWQGVLRDANNDVLGNQSVSVQLTIMKDGSAVMQETHSTTTSDLGLMNLQVCTGNNVSGDCASIDWSNGNFMLNVAVDSDGGSNYEDYGSSPIMMVPRASYAMRANEAVSAQTAQTANMANTAMDVVNDKVDDADADPTNEIQELMFDNQTRALSITGVAGTIRIPSTGQDADFDPENELQQLDKNAQGQIVLSHNNGFVVDGVVDDEVDDADADPMNEIQSLTLTGTDLSIENGNTVSLAGLGGGGTSVWTQTGQNINYTPAPPVPGASIEYGPGMFNVGLGGTQYRNITGRPNRLTDELSFATPNSSDKHSIGHYIQDFPSPDFSQIYMNINSDTMVNIRVNNWSSPGPQSLFQLWNEVQNTRVLGIELAAAGGFGQMIQTVGNRVGVRMGILSAGSQPYIGVADPNNAGSILSFMSTGMMGAPLKNFFMDHPYDDTKQIWYACIEGPEAAAYERGTAELVNGEAFIPFSEHFEIVMNPESMTVNLTPNSAESLGLAVVEKTEKGIRVKELFKGTGNYSFDWEAKAVRKGYEDYKVIRPKSDMQIMDEIELD